MRKTQLIDLHQDLLLHIQQRDFFNNKWQTSFGHIKNNNTKLVVASAFPYPENGDLLDPIVNKLIEKDLKKYNEHCEKDKSWKIVEVGDDVDEVLLNNKLNGLLLHIEGLNAFKNGDWNMLERWYEMGWRSLGIVCGLANSLGGGHKDEKQGLTDLGKKVIEWAQERNIVIDFAHMNRKTFWDVANIVNGPILVTHGNVDGLCPDVRNYDDKQLKRIARSGGTIGVFLAKTFVVGKDKPARVEHLMNHISYLRDLIGIDHIAIGTDFGGIITGTMLDLASLDDIDKLWNGLRDRGYTKEEIEKISCRNAQRVLKNILS